MGAAAANVSIGVASAILDNIPLMFVVLTMQPDMSLGQWLLITLTTGVASSLLPVRSRWRCRHGTGSSTVTLGQAVTTWASQGV